MKYFIRKLVVMIAIISVFVVLGVKQARRQEAVDDTLGIVEAPIVDEPMILYDPDGEIKGVRFPDSGTELNDNPTTPNPDYRKIVKAGTPVTRYHWLTYPMLCILPGQSIDSAVRHIACNKSEKEQKNFAQAIAAGADIRYRWPTGAYFSIPMELIEGRDLPDGLEAIGVLPTGHCPDDFRRVMKRFTIAGEVDVLRFRWFYPDSDVELESGQVYARAMQAGQIVYIPGVGIE